MAMNATTLFNELKAMPLGTNEAAAVTAWTDAFAAYFEGDGVTEGAESNALYIAAAAIPAAKAAMAAALSGMKGSGQGAAKIQAGIEAFWGALVPATAWPTVTAITLPVLLAGLAAALQTIFTNNKDGSVARDPALTAIANKIHEKNLGGTATWPGPVVMPIT